MHITLATLVLAAAGISGPCHAWLYDGGTIFVSGIPVSDTASNVWVTEPFILPQDSCVTAFGAAIARAFGAADMGFTAYLSDTLDDIPAHALATGTICPAGASYVYRYCYPDDSVRLNGGQMYFLSLAPNSNNFAGSVSFSYTVGAYYGQGSGDFGQTWSQVARPLSIRLDGYVVPEPDAYLIVIAGLLGLSVLRRMRGSRSGASPE